MNTDIRVKGGPELEAALKKVAENAAKMRPAHETAGAELAGAIALRTPRRTGMLAQSWDVQAGDDRVSVSSDVVYAPYVEYGTQRMAGAGMVSGALEAQTPAIETTYTGALAEIGRGAGFETKT